MARRVPVIFGVLVLVALLAIYGIPFLTQKREVIAATPTPNAVSAISPLTLAPGSKLCSSQVTFSPQAQVARFVAVGDPAKKGPPLTVTAFGPGYRAQAHVPGGYPGTNVIEVPIKTPDHSLIGTFCVRNAGKTQVLLAGTQEGRTVGRSDAEIDGTKALPQFSLTLHERKPAAIITRVGALFRHDSAFNPVPVFLIWVLALLVLLGVPALAFWSFGRSLLRDG